MTLPTGTELARPFVPAKDFARSKAFYEALGFETLLDGEVAIFGIGASSFILQNYYQEEWANNFMVRLMVDDLDAWWRHIEALDLPGSFGVPAPRPPAVQPWGAAHRLSGRSGGRALARRRAPRRQHRRLRSPG